MKTKKKTSKRNTKAAFQKWKRENPEEFRKVYGPWTSLEVTLMILNCVLPKTELKEDGSDILGNLPFTQGIDASEFIMHLAAECGETCSMPVHDTIERYIAKGSKKTVKDLSEVIERTFSKDPLDKHETFCDDGKDCKHFECLDCYKVDYDLIKDEFDEGFGKQQCYMCKHWDNSHGGEPCDCTLGECTYRWKDPNGDSQQTFWEEKWIV